MARTDENGRDLQVVLTYLLNRPVQDNEIYNALGIVAKTYRQRCESDSFPTAEDCRRIGRHFKLNPLDLMWRFALLDSNDVEGFLSGPLASGGTRTATRKKKGLSTRLPDVPEV